MNTLGKRKDHNDLSPKKNDQLPVILRKRDKDIPLGKAILISAIAHPLVIGLIWLLINGLILLLTMLGITLPIFEKPAPKVRDIEFVLTNKPEEKPVNPNTKYRSDKNSRAGGKHDPAKPVSEPEPRSASSRPERMSTPQSPAPKKAPMPTKPQQAHQNKQAEAPVPPRPRPTPSFSRPRVAPPNSFPIPVPRSKSPKSMSSNGGPVTSGPIGESSSGSSPAPIMSNGGLGSAGRGKQNSGYSMGGGNSGNPGPGNPNGRPGIDAIKEPNWGPYMRDLERRIKRNWSPPKGNESKRVVVYFKVGRDGRLLSLKTQKSSGLPDADNAATSAVELSAPFRPLPPEYKDNDIDIQFTFDYNVYGLRR